MGFYLYYRWPTADPLNSPTQALSSLLPYKCLKTGKKNAQLVFRSCYKKSWTAMLRVLPPTNQTCPATNEVVAGWEKLLQKLGRDYVYFLQQPLYVHAACFTGSRQTCFGACMAWLPRNFIQPKVSILTNLLARQIWTCKTRNIAFLLEETYWFQSTSR